MKKSLVRLNLVVLGLLLVACSGAPVASPTNQPTLAPTPGPTTGPTTAPTSSPSPSASAGASLDADLAVVKVEQTGGMLPPWETARWYPTAALYGDGRLIVQGPQIEIYPGPALPNLVVTHLSQAGVEQVLEWAAEAGLQGEDRQLGEAGFDSGVTVFTVETADGTHTTNVADMAAGDADVGALNQFVAVMTELPNYLPNEIASDPTPYIYDRLRVISFPVEAVDLPDPALATEVDWPLEPLAELGTSFGEPDEYRCALIEGEDLETLRPMLEQANELTLWRSDDVTYQIYAHPLLPDDEPCPGFPPAE
ncbi:MAG TPA: hypothetical protein VEX62_05200 [Candidatus Limnocylindrales bacterium]|nr:hypothetical protein [Candidatus Limnocylindrales bacterium]